MQTYLCILFKSVGDEYPPPLSSSGVSLLGWDLLNKQTAVSVKDFVILAQTKTNTCIVIIQ